MNKFEYRTLRTDRAAKDEELNALGILEWELVSVVYNYEYEYFLYVFKRDVEIVLEEDLNRR